MPEWAKRGSDHAETGRRPEMHAAGCWRSNSPGLESAERIRVEITQEDIDGGCGANCEHPLTKVLMRATKTQWRFVEPIMLVEKVAPFRTLILESELMMKLWDCKNGDCALPLECELDLLLPFRD
jgi:hypothetical protein